MLNQIAVYCPRVIYCITATFCIAATASANISENAAEAIAALEAGLKPNASPEESSVAGQRAEELLMGRKGSAARTAAPLKKGDNFLLRLSAMLPGKKKRAITVKEPSSYRRNIRELGMRPGMVLAGLGLGNGFIALLSRFPAVFESMPAWQQFAVILPIVLILLFLPNLILAHLGGFFAGLIDRFRIK